MNKKVKKIIAREFLILLALIILTSIIFLCVFPYNSFQKSNIDKIDNSLIEKEKLTENLNKTVNQKIENQEWFFEKLSNEFDIANSENSKLKTLWPILQKIAENDSIEHRWNNKWEKSLKDFHKRIGFKNATDLEAFIKRNSISLNDSIQLKKSDKIRKEITELKNRRTEFKGKILNENAKFKLAGGIGVILFGILFLLRYLIYAVNWSVGTLKEK